MSKNSKKSITELCNDIRATIEYAQDYIRDKRGYQDTEYGYVEYVLDKNTKEILDSFEDTLKDIEISIGNFFKAQELRFRKSNQSKIDKTQEK